MAHVRHSADYLIVGAGIIGLTIANELRRQYPRRSIIIIEKESQTGLHSSGRNSGVLHSGIYYNPESYKAKYSARGRVAMTEFCLKHKLPFRKIGKILLPVREEDNDQLQILFERGGKNGVCVQWLDENALRRREPEARSATGKALFVSVTSIANPRLILQKLEEMLLRNGVTVHKGVQINSIDPINRNIGSATTTYSYGLLINSAGLHADTVAHKFGAGHAYTLLPFKGIYWKLDPKSGLKINHLVYPVPDLRVPFLGVHSTTNTEGNVYLGPTAVPAFGRENYHGLQNISIRELGGFLKLIGAQLLTGRDGFRRLAWQEGRRYFKRWFAQAARAIFPRLEDRHLTACDKVGIRAQMYHKPTGRLANDFVIEKGESSVHILNAISPAWTCSMPFAEMVVSEYIS
jgi:(S)-2-hydroxyglutarate dehydrogenase